MITHVRMRFQEEGSKFEVRPIEDIKINEEDDNHFMPNDCNDFDPKKTYFCKWTNCPINCKDDHEHVGYYACHIYLLGESLEEIEQKIKKGKRNTIPRVKSDLGELPTKVKKIENTNEKDNLKSKKKVLVDRSKSVLKSVNKNSQHNYTDWDSDLDDLNDNDSSDKKEVQQDKYGQSLILVKSVKTVNLRALNKDANSSCAAGTSTMLQRQPDDNEDGNTQERNNDNMQDHPNIPEHPEIPEHSEIPEHLEIQEHPEIEEPVHEGMEDENEVPAHRSKRMKNFLIDCINYYKADGEGREERAQRYTINNDEIYLGENVKVKVLNWHFMIAEQPTIFLRSLATVLWPSHVLLNRALNVSRVVKNLPERSPVKILEPNLLRLFISLYSDHLDRQRGLSADQKSKLLMKATNVLSNKIRDLRKEEFKRIAARRRLQI